MSGQDLSTIEAAYRQAVKACVDPLTDREVVVKSLVLTHASCEVTLIFGYPIKDLEDYWQDQLRLLAQAVGVTQPIKLDMLVKIRAHQADVSIDSITKVRNVIAIASAKGGVGKSTTALGIAWGLKQSGARVGLLDADIYGPNVPYLLGCAKAPAQQTLPLQPVMQHDLATMSMAYCVSEKAPLVWRGPMVSGAIKQLCRQTAWPVLDYLVVDMPPGTGDVALTLCKQMPLSMAVVVTTPESLARIDTVKGIEMFNKLKIPVAGIIENMSHMVCDQCGHTQALYGHPDAVTQLAQEHALPVLAQMPVLPKQLQQVGGHGLPWLQTPDGEVAWRYRRAARAIAAKLSLQAVHYAVDFPKVVVES